MKKPPFLGDVPAKAKGRWLLHKCVDDLPLVNSDG